MVFTSLTFLFLFLPITLGLYYIFKGHRSIQNILLFLVSLFFYAWGEPRFVVILVVSIALNWLLALSIDRSDNKNIKKALLIFSLIIQELVHSK